MRFSSNRFYIYIESIIINYQKSDLDLEFLYGIYAANLIYSWGFSKYGQTAHENTNYILTPSIINFSQTINSEEFHNKDIDLVTGESHSAFLIRDSGDAHVYMCGKNIFGQLGLGDNDYIYEPKLLPSLSEKEPVKHLTLGGEHSLILTIYANIYSCGLNLFGQLGTGDFENRTSFTNIKINENILNDIPTEIVIDIVAGAQHSLMVTNLNRLYYCGFNKNKFLGINEDINLFTYIEDNKLMNDKIILIRARMNINGVLFEDKKTIAIFGQDLELINKSSQIILININDIEDIDNEKLEIKDFQLGNEFMIILLTNGKVYSCGINNKNQLGIEDDKIKTNKNDKKLIFYQVSLPE